MQELNCSLPLKQSLWVSFSRSQKLLRRQPGLPSKLTVTNWFPPSKYIQSLKPKEHQACILTFCIRLSIFNQLFNDMFLILMLLHSNNISKYWIFNVSIKCWKLSNLHFVSLMQLKLLWLDINWQQRLTLA